MSGYNYENPCPNCSEPMNCYSDRKPFDTSNGECLNCGFCYQTKPMQMSLDELNLLRQDYNDGNDYNEKNPNFLKPLKELPKCDMDKIW